MKKISLSTAKLFLNKILFLVLVLIAFVKFSYSQTYIEVNIVQPVKLQAHAGNDTIIIKDNSVTLGETPSVTGGKSSYSYFMETCNQFK